MDKRLLLIPALLAAAIMGGPASATETSSLSAFVASCPTDLKGCKGLTHDLITSAKNAKYGCVPAALSADDAGEQLLDWLKGPARANPKYEKMSLEDVMWEGVDTLWPCKAK